ncbi:hypothetical protein [Sphingobacterium yanglingense]|uniref:ACT domain-containing protein n=1 Tax=Sphingobacterium yanglingense TaxID=1437280 RepID=A0A4R6WKI1_9SPHI|nr:hypothetical protein [Sphingobacterium yanglingense]TDQ78260.1 hypothetical protein CLV99_2240 [Sphingobacterium yanglingense]
MTSKLFNISCKSSNETLVRILLYVSKTDYNICTMSQSSTDVQDVKLITLELEIDARSIDRFIEEILQLDGVLDVAVSFGSVLHIATYQMSCNSNTFDILHRIKSHNTHIINIEADKLLIVHIASEKDIRLLYNKLDNKSLLSFCQQPIAIGRPLSWDKVI